MKTLYPVDKATHEKIGAAYLVCSQYPEIFGDVPMGKFCSMFVDVIDEDEDERTARMRASAPEMYRILQEVQEWCRENDLDSDIECDIWEVLCHINGEEAKI
ncbi:MAG: hypothetical protein IJS39_14210 [Synergistaceae bacterium]|nr:hypothetical protein [Synergistaceae bacterium]